ncbi:uncharacterized protein LOC142231489 [Haematobia irritans]|uniref:uncharacterized protein LOC142231489 n=1 Tax=Haematobia irritans TaxID=7368 RepID=UPI003F50CCE1
MENNSLPCSPFENIDATSLIEITTSANNKEIYDYKNNLNEVSNSVIRFLVKLHTFKNLSRSDVYSIRMLTENLVLNPFLKLIEESQASSDSEKYPLSDVIKDIRTTFNNHNTEFRLLKSLREKNLIGNVHYIKDVNKININAAIMPLEFQFKTIFEHNDYLELVLNHIKMLEHDSNFTNFVQGQLWKQKRSLYPGKFLIPYFLYADDFGIDNPLGAKANKNNMCNFYYSFACPPQKSSKLDDIFLAFSVKSNDLKQHGSACLKPLVNTLKQLELKGVEIKTGDGCKRVHFIMGLLLGDNLGLNSILGFAKSFSANYFCRFCLMKKCNAQKESSEDIQLFRNRVNYRNAHERGLLYEDVGINDICPFDEIPSFHCTENFAVDLMHDVFEGVCHNILTEAIKYFINMDYVTLNSLNDRLSTFRYPKHDKGNEKLCIKKAEIYSGKLKMSAKQMMAFCHYFTILFGEYVMNGDKVWQFLLTFFELIDDLTCYKLSNSLINQIKNKVEKLTAGYQQLFKKSLTPKFHFLTHYPTILRQSGPPRNFWSFKYEALITQRLNAKGLKTRLH